MADADVLFTAHRDGIFRYLCRLVGHEDARELTQEVFLRSLQSIVLNRVRGTAPFAFAPLIIMTPEGPVTVQIGGSLRVTTADGPPELICTLMRSLKYLSKTGGRDATSSGSSSTKNPMPGPDDVLSLELPAIRTANGAATVPDQYSVRVRIR